MWVREQQAVNLKVTRRRARLCLQLAAALRGATTPAAALDTWNQKWQTVYALADAVCQEHLAGGVIDNASRL